jgi:AGCS family alanine or glycine:cation symporter
MDTLSTQIDTLFGTLVGWMATVMFWKIPGLEMPAVVAWLLFGAVFFTLSMRFVNFRLFFHAIELVSGKFDDPNSTGEVTHFQALASALSATVGLGNIAGVAIAVGTGGPGAVVWMVAIGVLGMSVEVRRVQPRTEVSPGQARWSNHGRRHVLPLGGTQARARHGRPG